jgi:tetratricopeptide (TPR) repeat protein
LGATLKLLGRLDEAEASYRQAIALKPEFAEFHNNLGNALQQLGRLDEAEASYRQAISLKPDFAEVHNNLGTTLKELGRLDEAEASYGQAIALMPSFTNALKNRWQLLYDKKQYETALRDADLCISKGARELDLTTLYALGRIEEIYKRIEIRSKSDGENISIAAFAAFVAESEKKRTAYNFCPNPIDFIHFSNLSSHLKDSPAYITELIEELDKIETIWEPSGKSTNTGFQTVLGMNLFKDPSGKIAQLKSIIIDELDAYYLKFHNESCSYIQKWPSVYDLFGWHVILKHQGYQSGHIHTGGWLSAVVYLNVVPSLGKDEGAIRFSLNGVHYSDVNSPELTFQPELGDIVFFPSSLHHRTIPFEADMDRISIAFDLAPGASGH